MLLLQALLERADDSPGCSPIYRDHRRSRMRGKIAYSQVERRSVEVDGLNRPYFSRNGTLDTIDDGER